MNKSSRNLGAVLAVLVLLLLIAGLVFVVVTVYKDPLQAEIASQESSAMESTTQTSETEPVYVAPKRIALFETADINGYLMNTTSGDPETFEYRLAYVAKVVENARESEDFDDVILIDGVRIEFKDGFALARSSNTTPVVVLRLEGDNEQALERIKKRN